MGFVQNNVNMAATGLPEVDGKRKTIMISQLCVTCCICSVHAIKFSSLSKTLGVRLATYTPPPL